MKQRTRFYSAAMAVLLALCAAACSSGEQREEVSAPSEVAGEPFPYPEVTDELAAAKAENPDVIGWLYVPGTTISEAVVQGKDNTYYLRRNYKGSYAYSGSLFLDYRADSIALSQNNVIYGHNLGSPMGRKDDPEGEKFAQLLKFADIEFAKQTPYLYLITEKEHYAFRIFSVAYAEAYTRPVEYHHEKYPASEFSQLTKDLQARSVHNYGVTVTSADKLLTLSTCTYKFGTYSQNPDQRFVVIGRLVKEGEAYAKTVELNPNASVKEPNFG